eukprot:SAG31_NODE_25581_length_458_cov_1.721448_1_plen_91_part_00
MAALLALLVLVPVLLLLHGAAPVATGPQIAAKYVANWTSPPSGIGGGRVASLLGGRSSRQFLKIYLFLKNKEMAVPAVRVNIEILAAARR